MQAPQEKNDVGEYVILNPSNKICFQKGENTSKMYIRNTSDRNVAFKIRTTHP